MELKSCPHCGKKAQLESRETPFLRKTRWFVRCTTSKCPGHPVKAAEYDSKEEAIKAWNRRINKSISE